MGIGNRIKTARESLGLTQKELAEKIEISSNAITNYETGVSFPKPDILYKLIGALGVDANFLFEDIMTDMGIKKEPREPQNTREALILMLEKFGLIAPGRDLSAADADFLVAVGTIIDQRFKRD